MLCVKMSKLKPERLRDVPQATQPVHGKAGLELTIHHVSSLPETPCCLLGTRHMI